MGRPDRPRARERPREGDPAPRPEARERVRDSRGGPEDPRLRPRPAAASGGRGGPLERGRDRLAAHGGRSGAGDARLHVARAGARPPSRRAHRHLRAGGDSLRDAHGAAGLPAPDRSRHALCGPDRGPDRVGPPRQPSPAGGAGPAAVPGQGPRAAVPVCGRPGRRPRGPRDPHAAAGRRRRRGGVEAARLHRPRWGGRPRRGRRARAPVARSPGHGAARAAAPHVRAGPRSRGAIHARRPDRRLQRRLGRRAFPPAHEAPVRSRGARVRSRRHAASRHLPLGRAPGPAEPPAGVQPLRTHRNARTPPSHRRRPPRDSRLRRGRRLDREERRDRDREGRRRHAAARAARRPRGLRDGGVAVRPPGEAGRAGGRLRGASAPREPRGAAGGDRPRGTCDPAHRRARALPGRDRARLAPRRVRDPVEQQRRGSVGGARLGPRACRAADPGVGRAPRSLVLRARPRRAGLPPRRRGRRSARPAPGARSLVAQLVARVPGQHRRTAPALHRVQCAQRARRYGRSAVLRRFADRPPGGRVRALALARRSLGAGLDHASGGPPDPAPDGGRLSARAAAGGDRGLRLGRLPAETGGASSSSDTSHHARRTSTSRTSRGARPIGLARSRSGSARFSSRPTEHGQPRWASIAGRTCSRCPMERPASCPG